MIYIQILLEIPYSSALRSLSRNFACCLNWISAISLWSNGESRELRVYDLDRRLLSISARSTFSNFFFEMRWKQATKTNLNSNDLAIDSWESFRNNLACVGSSSVRRRRAFKRILNFRRSRVLMSFVLKFQNNLWFDFVGWCCWLSVVLFFYYGQDF